MSESAPVPTVAQAETLLQQADAELLAAHAAEAAARAAKIDAWFTDHFNCLPVGWDTPMRNHVVAAVADLKARLGRA